MNPALEQLLHRVRRSLATVLSAMKSLQRQLLLLLKPNKRQAPKNQEALQIRPLLQIPSVYQLRSFQLGLPTRHIPTAFHDDLLPGHHLHIDVRALTHPMPLAKKVLARHRLHFQPHRASHQRNPVKLIYYPNLKLWDDMRN